MQTIWKDSNRLAGRGQLSGWAAKRGLGMTGNTKSSWGTIARSFHWILGLAIIGMIAYGWWMNHFPARADRYFYRSIHADIGYLVLLLTVIRLVWRSVNPTPDLPGDTPRWISIVARVNHWALYLVTVVVAMLGWAMSGARPPNQQLCELLRLVQRAAVHLARQGRRRRLRRPAHPVRLCAAGADRPAHRRRGLASLRQARSRRNADDQGNGDLEVFQLRPRPFVSSRMRSRSYRIAPLINGGR